MVRDPVLPALRAATFSAVCLALGVGAHRMMSGAAIPLWAMLFGTACVYALARVGSGRERGLLGIAALIGALQIGLHLLFDYAQQVSATEAMRALARAMTPGICKPPAVSTPMTDGMSMPMSMSMPGMKPAPAMVTAVMPGSHMPVTGMLLAHVLAAVLSAVLLHRGEAALHALGRSAGAWVLTFIAAPVPVVRMRIRYRRRRPRIESAARRPRSQFLRSSRWLRGPPRIASFA
jgi:hypothetical protein